MAHSTLFPVREQARGAGTRAQTLSGGRRSNDQFWSWSRSWSCC